MHFIPFYLQMTQLFLLKEKNEAELINSLNTELQKLNCWLKANKLTINISKSHVMVFHRDKK